MRLMHGKGLWFVAGLLGLGVLVNHSINNAVKTKSQPVNNKVTDMASMVRSHLSGGSQPSVKEDASSLVDNENDLLEVGNPTDQAPVYVGEHIDADADPGKYEATESLSQRNVGMFLEVGEDPSVQSSQGVLPQRNGGKFLDVDGVDSDIVISNEQKKVNIGDFIDADG